MQNNFFCKNPYINLYEKSSYKSKIASQILYGEKFKILSKKKKFFKAKNLYDGYIGYIKSYKHINKFANSSIDVSDGLYSDMIKLINNQKKQNQ